SGFHRLLHPAHLETDQTSFSSATQSPVSPNRPDRLDNGEKMRRARERKWHPSSTIPIRPETRRFLRKKPEPRDYPNGPAPGTRPDCRHQTKPDHYVACGL